MRTLAALTLQPERARRLVWLLASAWISILLGWTAYVVLTDRPVDYYTYAIAADSFAHGQNIYRDSGLYSISALRLGVPDFAPPYRYPLLTALVIAPLLGLPIRVGAAIFIFASGLACVAATLVIASRCDPTRKVLVVLLGMVFVPFYTTLHAGQVNAFPLMFLILSLFFLTKRSFLSGALFAIGLLFKPFAFAIVPWLLWRREWRAFFGMAVAGVVILAIGLFAFGIEPTLDQFRLGGSVAAWGFFLTVPTNQNLNGLIGRWFTSHAYGGSLADAPDVAWAMYLVLAGAFVLAALAVLRSSGRAGSVTWVHAAFIIVTTELVFPVAFYHHLTIEFPAVALALASAPYRMRPRRFALFFGVFFVLFIIPGLAWKRLVGYTPLLDLGTIAQIMLWGLIAYGLVTERRRVTSNAATPVVNDRGIGTSGLDATTP